MAIGSRQSIGPLQIAEIDINLINDVFRQIQDALDTLAGLTGVNLSVKVADASTVPAGSIVKALTSTTLEAAVAGTDYVAPSQEGAVFGLTINKVPKALTAKTLTDSNISDSGTVVGVAALLDLSVIPAGNPVIKFTSTTDIPVTVWTAGVPSGNPAGYLEIRDGATVGYIAYWL